MKILSPGITTFFFAALFAATLGAASSIAQLNTPFQAQYGGAWHEAGRTGVKQLANGRFIATGEGNTNSSSMDIYVVVTQANTTALTFERTYNIAGDDYGTDIEGTADGGYIVTGYTRDSLNEGGHIYGWNIFLMKLFANGGVDWCMTYSAAGGIQGNNRDEHGYDVVELPDWNGDGTRDGYAVCGLTNAAGHGGTTLANSYDGFILRTDINGAITWVKYYGVNAANDYLYSLTVDGNDLVACGETYRNANQGADAWVIKVAGATGATTWSRSYGWPNATNDRARCVRECLVAGTGNTGHYLVTGTTGAAATDGLLMLVNSGTGALIGSRTYHLSTGDVLNGVVEDPNGDFIATGHATNASGSSSLGGQDLWLMRVIGSGVNQFTLGATGFSSVQGWINDDQGWSVNIASGLNGETYSIVAAGLGKLGGMGSPANNQLYLLRTGQNGNLDATCPETDVTPTVSNPTVTVTTLSESPLDGLTDWQTGVSARPWTRVRSCPASTWPKMIIDEALTGEGEPVDDHGVSAYPNPVKRGEEVKLGFANRSDMELIVTVSDVSGATVQTRTVPAGASEITIDTDGWSSGTYLVQVAIGEKKIVRQIAVID